MRDSRRPTARRRRDAARASGSCSSAPPASSARSRCRCSCAAIPTSARCSCWCARAPARRRRIASSRRSRRRRRSIRSASAGATAPRRSCARSARRWPATCRGRCCNFTEADLEQHRQARRHHQLRRAWCRSTRRSRRRCASTCSGPKHVARRGAQDRRRGGAHLDLLRRRQPRRRGLGRRAARRLLPAQGPRSTARRPTRCATTTSRSTLEIADCQRIIDQVKSRADDRAHVSRVPRHGRRAPQGRRARRRRRAHAQDRRAARAQDVGGREAHRPRHGARAALGLAQHLHVHQVARRPGVRGAPSDVRACIVRPAIVESALRYPFAGLERGLHHLGAAGVPVDQGAPHLSRGRQGDARHHPRRHGGLGADHGDGGDHRRAERAGLSARLVRREPAVHEARGRAARPAQAALLLASASDKGEGIVAAQPGAVAHGAGGGLARALRQDVGAAVDVAGQEGDRAHRRAARRAGARRGCRASPSTPRRGSTRSRRWPSRPNDLFQLFMPFIYEREYVFRCDNIRALYARLTPHDRALLRWDPEQIDWRHYWLDVHMRGLEKWIFPNLEEEFKARPKSVYTYRDLLEMFDATTKHHRHRTAMRLLPTPDGDDAEPQRYTYARPAGPGRPRRRRCCASAAWRRRQGDAAVGEPARVGHHLLRHPEGRRAWWCRSTGSRRRDEVQNLIGWARARAVVLSDKVRERLERARAACWAARRSSASRTCCRRSRRCRRGGARAPSQGRRPGVAHLHLGHDRAAQGRHALAPQLLVAACRSWPACSTSTSTTASCRCCRCTTRSSSPPACSCRSCAARRSPTSTRSTPTRSTHAFDEGNITGMVGVPALWQLLHRKIDEDRAPSAGRGPSASSICSSRAIASCATRCRRRSTG